MRRPHLQTAYRLLVTFVLAAGMATAYHAASAQEHEEFKNLKVLPKDIPVEQLRAVMGQFTRALGVRCNYCHAFRMGQQQGLDFASDEKDEKRTARVMMQMTHDLNANYIGKLEDHSDPPIQVQCATCHRGIAHPRQLADVLKLAYAKGGVDTTRARYSALRDQYYGRAAYDFGEVPISEVATALADSGHVADAVNLYAYNLEVNPKSAFAQRQAAGGQVLFAFSEQGGDSGVAVYQRMKSQIGQPQQQEGFVSNIGERMLKAGKTETAIAAYKLNTVEHPTSGFVFDDLAGAYLKRGGKDDKKLAIDAYLMAVSLDTTNTDAVKQLQDLKVSKSKIEKAKSGKK